MAEVNIWEMNLVHDLIVKKLRTDGRGEYMRNEFSTWFNCKELRTDGRGEYMRNEFSTWFNCKETENWWQRWIYEKWI